MCRWKACGSAARLRGADGAHAQAGIRTVNGAWKIDGRWIDDRTRNDAEFEIMLGGALARRLSVKPGDTLSLFGQPFTVVGVITTGGEEEDQRHDAPGSPAAAGQPPRIKWTPCKWARSPSPRTNSRAKILPG